MYKCSVKMLVDEEDVDGYSAPSLTVSSEDTEISHVFLFLLCSRRECVDIGNKSLKIIRSASCEYA